METLDSLLQLACTNMHVCMQKDNRTTAIVTVINMVCVSMLTGMEVVYNTGNNNK